MQQHELDTTQLFFLLFLFWKCKICPAKDLSKIVFGLGSRGFLFMFVIFVTCCMLSIVIYHMAFLQKIPNEANFEKFA